MSKILDKPHLQWGVYYKGVLVAAFISERSANVCKQSGDASGNHDEPLVVKRIRRPAPRQEEIEEVEG